MSTVGKEKASKELQTVPQLYRALLAYPKRKSFLVVSLMVGEDTGATAVWLPDLELLGPQDLSAVPTGVSLFVPTWLFSTSLSATGGGASKALSSVSFLEVKTFLSLVFLFDVSEKLLPRFSKFNLSNSRVKSETGGRRATSPLGASGPPKPGVL
jgi:hypothetical protein